jgi:hypothetical protein
MKVRPSIVQRAFEIAKSGTVANTTALQAQLTAEGYPNSVEILAGRTISMQLSRIIHEGRVGR